MWPTSETVQTNFNGDQNSYQYEQMQEQSLLIEQYI